jgi:hypothetical protein
VYCSGIPVPDGRGKTITTAEDILQSKGDREMRLWVAQDSCPPSPGCTIEDRLTVAQSGTTNAEIWQYSQTPRRPQFAESCAATYAPDNRCYAPGTQVFVDFDVAAKGDPSQPPMEASTAANKKRSNRPRVSH